MGRRARNYAPSERRWEYGLGGVRRRRGRRRNHQLLGGKKRPDRTGERILTAVALTAGSAPDDRLSTTGIGNTRIGLNWFGKTVSDAEVLVDETVTHFLPFGKIIHRIVFIVDEQCSRWACTNRIRRESVFSGNCRCRIDEVCLSAGEAIDDICSTVEADSKNL